MRLIGDEAVALRSRFEQPFVDDEGCGRVSRCFTKENDRRTSFLARVELLLPATHSLDRLNRHRHVSFEVADVCASVSIVRCRTETDARRLILSSTFRS